MLGEHLYEIETKRREILERMEQDADPETGEVPEALWDEYESLQAKAEELLADLVVYRDELGSEIDQLKVAKRGFESRIAQKERMRDRLEARLIELRPDHQKFKDPQGRFGTAYFQETVSTEVLVEDAIDLPLDCVELKYVPKKTAIKEALLEGREDLLGKAKIVRRWGLRVR